MANDFAPGQRITLLFICFVYSLCAKLSTFLSLLTLPQHSSLYKRKTIFSSVNRRSPTYATTTKDRPGPSWDYGDFTAPGSTSPTPGICGLCPVFIPWIFVAFCGSPDQCFDKGEEGGCLHLLRFCANSSTAGGSCFRYFPSGSLHC